MTITIRPLNQADTQEYKRTRLKALQTEPTAFASAYETACRLPDDFFLERAVFKADSFLFGAFDQITMVGMAGGYVDALMKRSHIGNLVSVWVEQDYRGQGLATRLCQSVIEQFRDTPNVSIVQLSVTVGNDDARHIYRQLGFQEWGKEPKSISYKGVLYDEYHMALEL